MNNLIGFIFYCLFGILYHLLKYGQINWVDGWSYIHIGFWIIFLIIDIIYWLLVIVAILIVIIMLYKFFNFLLGK